MADTITVDEYRTAAKVNSRLGFGGEAEICLAQASELEAESARDEYLDELAQHAERYVRGAYTWDHDDRGIARDAIEAAVNKLAADGRLLPGGEERTVYDDTTLKRVYRGLAAAGIEIRQALDVVNQIQNQGILFRRSPDDGWIDPPAVSVPDSGPDGTPEKPWPTWRDVPEGVGYQSTDGRYSFVNRNGLRYPAGPAGESKFRSSFSDVVMATIAPFVRVDGDKA
ncbi:hypothetical protein [Prescottella equi]|uniref:hypothetical protein n=1 Tax=Rhodococcus hoagii TaxID=43767 RepID=UPI00111BD77F|nr:hypothetical protein [Prescottella equi]